MISIYFIWVKQTQLTVNQLNPLMTTVLHRIKTTQLICNANQWTGFFMMGNIGR